MLSASLMSVLCTGSVTADVDPKAGKQIIFNDEFEGSDRPNLEKWLYEVGKIRNGEAQYYTKDRKENARLENGSLVIEARKEPYEGSDVTSASLTTIKSWSHVYVEVRAQFPTGVGTWPAIWLLADAIRKPKDQGFINWPDCGEIDMMENVGFDPENIHFTIHTGAYNHMKGTQKAATRKVPEAWKSYHTYGLDWQKDKLDFYFNGEKVFTYAKESDDPAVWPYDRPHYLILNLAIGGGWGGQKGIEDSIFPSKFLVDYVRIYK